MARQFHLLPDDTYKRLVSRPVNQEGPTEAREPSPELKIYGQTSDEGNSLSSLAELMPKNMRSRAKLLLHYLNDNVQLDSRSHVVYSVAMPDGTTVDQQGSSIADLVRYFISPASHFGQPSASRPLDSPRFAQLLLAVGVPAVALGAGKKLEDIASIEQRSMQPTRIRQTPKRKKQVRRKRSRQARSKRRWR